MYAIPDNLCIITLIGQSRTQGCAHDALIRLCKEVTNTEIICGQYFSTLITIKIISMLVKKKLTTSLYSIAISTSSSRRVPNNPSNTHVNDDTHAHSEQQSLQLKMKQLQNPSFYQSTAGFSSSGPIRAANDLSTRARTPAEVRTCISYNLYLYLERDYSCTSTGLKDVFVWCFY